jgi:hypothetical protein
MITLPKNPIEMDLDTFFGWYFEVDDERHGRAVDINYEVATDPCLWVTVLRLLAEDMEQYCQEHDITNIHNFRVEQVGHLPYPKENYEED